MLKVEVRERERERKSERERVRKSEREGRGTENPTKKWCQSEKAAREADQNLSGAAMIETDPINA